WYRARNVRAAARRMGCGRDRGELLRGPCGRARGGGEDGESHRPAHLRRAERGAPEGRGRPEDLPGVPRGHGELRAPPDPGPRAQSRMGALLSSIMIQREVGIETVTHYSCRDRNLLGMLSDVLGAAAAGLRNILIITGDPPKMGPYPDATAVFDIDAIGLTNLV